MQTLSINKIVATVFRDRKSVLLIDFLERGETINEKYCETLKKLRRTIQNKQRGKLGSKILFVHDNARSYIANHTRNF